MLIASFIITTIALVLGLLTFPFFITLPFCIIFAFISLIIATINYIKKQEDKEQIVNIIAIAYSAVVIIALLFIFIALYKTAVIDNIALVILTLNII